MEGAFWACSATRRARLVALWRHVHRAPSQASAPRHTEELEAADFAKRIKDAWAKG